MALITNIQRCSTKDGPGIRTTIFFKGCPLKCAWCHNPETQKYERDIMVDYERCTCCGVCLKKCKNKAITIKNNKITTDFDRCDKCGECIDFCVKNAREVVGEEYTVDELFEEVEKDIIFFESSGGGVTLSGGEVMLQHDFVYDFAKKCYENHISVDIDTCGYTEFKYYKRILPYVDLFLYDLKIMNKINHKKLIGKSNELILKNLEELNELNANINLRIPIIDGVNSDDENISEIITYLLEKKIKITQVNILPYHNIGVYKYEKLNIKYSDIEMKKPTEKKLKDIEKKFKKSGFKTKIGG